MLQTCEVLTYLHNQVPPVIHRDLKPSNLLVRTLDNQIVVIDFGAVKEAGSTSGTRISVEGYSAPEQGLGRSQIHSDLYAVGATLIFLLTGQNPFKFYKIGGQGYQLQLPDLPNIPPSLKAVIERATKPQPADRYQTAAELAIALKNC
jgi:serine/threonine-protein kinase